MQRFRGGLVFKAHRLLYHSTLGMRVMKMKKKAMQIQSAPSLCPLVFQSTSSLAFACPTVTEVDRGFICALGRSTLDVCLGGQRSCEGNATGAALTGILSLFSDSIMASIYDKYSVGASIRAICTRCCFTVTNVMQTCRNFHCAPVFIQILVRMRLLRLNNSERLRSFPL